MINVTIGEDVLDLADLLNKICRAIGKDAGEIWELQQKVKTLEYQVERLEALVDRHTGRD
jgi:hypothetical protein